MNRTPQQLADLITRRFLARAGEIVTPALVQDASADIATVLSLEEFEEERQRRAVATRLQAMVREDNERRLRELAAADYLQHSEGRRTRRHAIAGGSVFAVALVVVAGVWASTLGLI